VHCRRGGKLVLFITGECRLGCFYCPLSEKKYGHDVIYANERPVKRATEAIEEAEAMDATGTGVTGGDPILRLDRTCKWIHALRSRFGDGHHIHLYTATPITRTVAERLVSSGLDELRVHVPAASWNRPDPYLKCLRNASTHGIDVGVEIPVVPKMGKDLDHLLDELEGTGISFVNLNELEFSDTTISAMSGYESVGDGYAVKGSRAIAEKAVRSRDRDYAVHFCSVRYKDSGQLRRRLIRRARNTMRRFQEVTDDGTLLFAIVEGEKRVALDEFARLKVPNALYAWNEKRHRLELAAWIADRLASRLCRGLKLYIVEEYPTWDSLEVERIPLGK
jgi:pyruvate formate-lyase activating enzyme-like uncharacterized protein